MIFISLIYLISSDIDNYQNNFIDNSISFNFSLIYKSSIEIDQSIFIYDLSSITTEICKLYSISKNIIRIHSVKFLQRFSLKKIKRDLINSNEKINLFIIQCEMKYPKRCYQIKTCNQNFILNFIQFIQFIPKQISFLISLNSSFIIQIPMLFLAFNQTIDDFITTTNTNSISTTPIIQSTIIPTTEIPISYNEPKFCENVSWNPNGITFLNISLVGSNPTNIFIDTNNFIYITEQNLNRIQIWNYLNENPIKTISNNLSGPIGLFVSLNGNIYIDNGYNQRIEQWNMNSTYGINVMNMTGRCYSIFIDLNNKLYCSEIHFHRIISTSLNDNLKIIEISAGVGYPGSLSNQLYSPIGIFVDKNLNLYVADTLNDRIQKFLWKQLNGTTIVGNGSSSLIKLSRPTYILLDGNNYLYIVDSYQHRIIRIKSNFYQCLVGCSQSNGSLSNQLTFPWTFSFDTYGNIFVVDYGNSRIQLFHLINNSCDQTTSSIQTTTINHIQVSYNQPKFCLNPQWNENGTTFATNSWFGLFAWGFFIDRNNTIYVAARNSNLTRIWFEGNKIPNKTLADNLNGPVNLFVTINGDIYIENGLNKQINKWTFNSTKSINVMNIPDQCFGLFIDINNNIYCSITTKHIVMKNFNNGSLNESLIIAGNGLTGNLSNQLNNPNGIFVDINFDLYIADRYNHRIQLFPNGQIDGITVAGITASISYSLNYPTDIILDKNNYLYIVDNGNNRIVASGLNGFRCIAGCTNVYASTPNTFKFPTTLHFDSYGNLYVFDANNHRIQNFTLITDLC